MSNEPNTESYPLSPMQHGMLFHSLTAPQSGVDLEQIWCTLPENVQPAALERAWQSVIERHEILRTTFHWEKGGEPRQKVLRRGRDQLFLRVSDWRGKSSSEQEELFETKLRTDRDQGFKLSEEPPIRVALFRLGDANYRLLWSFHHLLADGRAVVLVFQQLFAFYDAFVRGENLELPPAQPYRKFIEWFRGQDLSATEAFWRQNLKGFSTVTSLRVVEPSPIRTGLGDPFGEQGVGLSEFATARLKALAREAGVTTNTLLQGAWALLLSRYSGEEDVVFGAIRACRRSALPGADSMVGLFINTLPFRVSVPAQLPVAAWLQLLRQSWTSLRDYEHAPLALVQQWSELPPGQALFETILNYQEPSWDAALCAQGGAWTNREFGIRSRSNYPLVLDACGGTTLSLKILYHRARFDGETVARMLGHLKSLLDGMAANPSQQLSQLSLLTPTERHELLNEWNDTAVDFPKNVTALELFEEQTARTPDALAVMAGETSLTYQDLDDQATKLVGPLRHLGVGPNVRVGVCLERSPEMVFALLGVWKAGGAYVPLDPSSPEERLAFMVRDANLAAVVTHSRWREKFLPATPYLQVLCVDALPASAQRRPPLALAGNAKPSDLSYVIYTSGSTGTPKGVEIEHRSLMNLIAWHSRTYQVTPADRATQIAAPTFDASVWELWPYLTAGASIHIPSEETRLSPTQLAQWLVSTGVTLTFVPTPLLERMLDLDWPRQTALRAILTGGDTLHRAPGLNFPCALVNHYGPTENTVVATCTAVPPTEGNAKPPPIGRPISNTKVYILDRQRQPVPVGVAGELCIGGVGLARGYLRRTDLTSERFILNPFEKTPGGTLYRTGDFARWRQDGQIEFLGRMDHQVKVLGQRIELGEIESVLNQHPDVREALAMVLSDASGKARLVAWVVPSSGHSPAPHGLRAFVAQKLPRPMVPSALVVVDSFPLTPNGKVDRAALPAPVFEPNERCVLPRDPTEEALAAIWREVLGVKTTGVLDSFFELGGHSLLATQVISRIRDAFGVELPLKALFDGPTIEALARRIEAARNEPSGATVPRLARRGGNATSSLSFAQQRIWFMEQMEPGLAVNNIPVAIHLDGPLNTSALERALNELVRRHETLRTSFMERHGLPVAEVQSALPLNMRLLDLDALPPGQRDIASERLAYEEARRPFDLAGDALLRAALVRFSSEEHLLLLTAHHIACDGWSLGVCYGELSTLYSAFVRGQPAPLSLPAVEYADFAHWQRQWLTNGLQEAHTAFWKRQLEGRPQALDLPTDRPRPPVQTYRGAAAQFQFPAGLSAGLERLCREEDVTLFMVLLAGLQTLLHRYSGQDDILVGSPVSVRPCVETENLVGLFLNTLVLRGDCSGDPTFRELLKRVRQTALGAYAHQDLPFERLVEVLQPERDLSRPPLFQVMLILQNEPLRPLELPGLNLRPVPTHSGTAKFDLLFSVEQGPGGLSGFAEYNTDLFDPATIGRMLGHLQNLLENAVANPGQALSALNLLSRREREQLVHEWNQTTTRFACDKCIHELIEEQAKRTPEAIAVVFEQEQLTYRELEERAERVAAELGRLGVGPDTRVGLCARRSLEMMVGLLAILKAGGCYVPLDPAYPRERLAFMLEDSGAAVLLTEQWLQDGHAFDIPGLKTLFIESALRARSCGRYDSKPRPEHLAYVLYTSGSTGKPKGVMVTHRNVVNFFAGMDQLLGVNPGVWLAVTSISFDISVLELLWTLARGFKVVVHPEETPSLAALPHPSEPARGSSRSIAQQISFHGVTHLQCTPSLAGALALVPESLEALGSLEKLLLGGEALPVSLARQIWPKLRGKLLNVYGPTETTVWSAAHRVADLTDSIPIGRPLANTQIYILDGHLRPAPTGVVGEIVIGGEGVARGYLGRPELTAERFVQNPFHPNAAARLYRTGDLGRLRADGTLECLGRLDQQIKIRGHRIEPGEIEAALAGHPGVREAVVVAREDQSGDKRLVAYVVSQSKVEPGELRRFLEDKLPETMRPSVFVFLAALPLTPNGKVNRQALPAPGPERPNFETIYRAPETPMETTIAKVWQELLGVEKVGLNDNFFDLGGHSLLVVRAQVILQEKLRTPIPVLKLFQYPTVGALAGFLTGQADAVLGNLTDRGLRKRSAFGRRRRPEEAVPA